MAFLLLLAVWVAVAAAGVCGALFSYHILKGTFRRKLESEKAQWHLRHQQDSPAAVIENVSLGWLNLLTQSLWVPVIEKHVAGLTAELLSKVLLEVIEKNSQKAPWKFLDAIEIEKLSFGMVPPSFQVAQAKFDPAASMLTISVDVRFTSSSAQAVLLVCSKAVGVLAPVTVRLEVTHVKLRGRLRLGLLLAQEAPGIQGVYYSFSSTPHLDVGVRPLGLPLPTFLPGVDTALRDVLTKLISRRLVEPQRRFVDVHRIYMNKHIARVGGPGGLLRVTVIRASSLVESTRQQQQAAAAAATAEGPAAAAAALSSRSKSSKAVAPGSSAARKQLSSYCEVVFGQAIFRTPIVHHANTSDASWNWQFSVALPHELSSWPAAAAAAAVASSGASSTAAAAELSLLVFDAQTVGPPVLLGKTKVDLTVLQLQPNGPARTLLLPLKKASSSAASLQLAVQWLKSTKPPVSPQQQQQQQMRRTQQGQRAPAPLATAPQQQYVPATEQQQQAPPLSPQRAAAAAADVSQPDSVAVQVSGKSVSWQDKAQLRVHSAATAAKQSFKQLVSKADPDNGQGSESTARSSSSASGTIGTAADAAVAATATAAAAAGVAAKVAAEISSQHASNYAADIPKGGPWSSTATSPAADRSDDSESQPAALHAEAGVQQQQQRAPTAAAPAASSKGRESPGASGSAAAHVSRSSSSHSSSSQAQQHRQASSSWLKGWGAWLWGDNTPDEDLPPAAADARTSSSFTAAGVPAAAATCGGSRGASSPWPSTGPGDESEEEGSESSESGLQGPADVSRSSSPLVLLSHVVHMQKELEQQRQQLEAVQQQLERATSSYQKLKHVCRQRGRAALMQGARFLLHSVDGSTQHVLVYLSQAGSTRGVQSRLGRQQQQQPDTGLMLVIAALPETRRQARLAYGRLAAGQAEGQALAAVAAVGDAPEGKEVKHPALSGGSVMSASGGGNAGGSAPRMSAFGSVGAGLRLRLQRGTMLQLGYESGKFPRSVLQVLATVPANQLVGVVRGNMHFVVPTTTHGGSMGGGANSSSGGGIMAAECFSLLVQQESSGVSAINLQLPPVGNGRCLDEWLLALRDVAGPVEPINMVAMGLLAAATTATTQRSGDAAAAASSAGAAPVLQGHQEQQAAEQRGRSHEPSRRTTAATLAGLSSVTGVIGAAAGGGSSAAGLQPAAAEGTEHPDDAGDPAGGVDEVVAMQEAVVERQDSDSSAQHGRVDWLLPSAAAAATPVTPWVGATSSGAGAGQPSDSDSNSSSDDDEDND